MMRFISLFRRVKWWCGICSDIMQQREAWLAELMYKPLREGLLNVFGDQEMPAAAARLLSYLLHPSKDGGFSSSMPEHSMQL